MRLVLEAVRDLRANRVRSLLTGATLFVGVLSVVAIITIGSVVRDVFIATEEQKDGRAVTVDAIFSQNVMSNARLATMLRVFDRRVVGQGSVYALEARTGTILGTGNSTSESGNTSLMLLAGRLDRVRRLPVLHGRWLGPDRTVFPAELVVNQAAASAYGGVGTTLSVQPSSQQPPLKAKIVGVIADGYGNSDVYASMSAMLAYRPVALEGTSFDLFVHDASASESDIEGLTQTALGDLGVDIGGIDIHRYDRVDQLLSNLRATQSAFLGAAAVLLAVAVIGLLNIGLASVRERSRELVIRRAVGATRARVFCLVLLSGITIALIAAILAIGAALVTVTFIVPRLLDPARALNAPQFPWSAAVIGVATGIGAALAGGISPAIVAARIDVAYALRD